MPIEKYMWHNVLHYRYLVGYFYIMLVWRILISDGEPLALYVFHRQNIHFSLSVLFHTPGNHVRATYKSVSLFLQLTCILLLNTFSMHFSRRFSSEKSPTITVTSFFLFFRQTTDLIAYVPLFTDLTRSRVLVSAVFTRFTVDPAVTGSSPCLSQNLFRAIFFRHYATIFRIFLPSKGPTFNFLIFCSKLQCQKAQRVSLFRYFGTMRLFKILILLFFQKFLKNSKIFFTKDPPFNLFDILQQTGFSKTRRVPLLQV